VLKPPSPERMLNRTRATKTAPADLLLGSGDGIDTSDEAAPWLCLIIDMRVVLRCKLLATAATSPARRQSIPEEPCATFPPICCDAD